MHNYDAECRRAVRGAAPLFGLNATHIHVALVDTPTMTGLNHDYRNKGCATDVLTFHMNEPGWMGDVVICLPYAQQQAKKRGVTLKHELDRLIVHGVAHLAGYTHDSIPHFSAMRSAEFSSLQRILR